VSAVLAKWPELLTHALTDTLSPLAEVYGKAVRGHQESKFANVNELVDDIRKVAAIRNVLCHGSWPPPNTLGKSIPHFFDKKARKFDTPVDIELLQQVQATLQNQICSVIDSVTAMGYQFPGGAGSGTEIWAK
jgi:hypothetical protein